MLSLQLITFGIIIAALVLAWGLLMALNPTRFWDLAKVDWNADVVDTHDYHKRRLVRIAGYIISILSTSMIIGLVLLLLNGSPSGKS
jgi:hypothetical protein